MKKEPEILEGEVLTNFPHKAKPKSEPKSGTRFGTYATSNFLPFLQLQNNCRTCFGFGILIILLAILFKSWPLVFLIFLVPFFTLRK